MKIRTIILSVLTGFLALTSCEDDTVTPVKDFTAPVITNPAGPVEYTLIPENDNGTFETFIWDAAYLGEDVEPTYTIQIDLSSGDFTTPLDVKESTTQLWQSVGSGEMNLKLRELGVRPEVKTLVQARVKAEGGGQMMASVPITFFVTRYMYDDEIPAWSITGSAVAPDEYVSLIYDEGADIWKATLLLNEGDFLFKDQSSQQTVLGSDGTENGLVENGEPIAVENAVYAIELDVTNKTYKLTKSSFPNNLYLVGSHVGWDPGAATENKNFFNGTYEIYQYSADPFECKWLPQLGSWEGDYGDDPNNPGSILQEDEINVVIPEGGMWYIKADLAAMKWEAVKTTWGIIGSATPNGWDSQIDFSDFDPETNTYTMTVDLTQGEMKFRGTPDWSINYGGDGLSGEPIRDGANIQIPEAGTYKIVLVLAHGGNYSYSIDKQ